LCRLTDYEVSRGIHDRLSGGTDVNTTSQIAPNGAPSAAELIGRVSSISGGQAKITLASPGLRTIDNHATGGRLLGIQRGAALIIAMISAVDQESGSGATDGRSVARVELIGEIRTTAGVPRFQRGIEGYPRIGDGAVLVTERELRVVYGTVDADRAL